MRHSGIHRGYLIGLLFLSAASLHALPALAGVSADTRSLIEGAFNCVYQIKTSVDADAPKTSYGSGFVIDRAGILATNFHVVIDAMQKPKDYKVFVVHEGKATEAHVIGIDAVDDIAILKVDKTFPCQMKLAPARPALGERMYSIGIPEDLNKSIVEGVYNGEDQFGPYSAIQMSSAINSGMSGGPTVNKNGEVVGLNVAILRSAQNLAFAVPLSRLRALLAKDPVTLPVDGKIDTLNREIRSQLDAAQRKLADDFVAAMRKTHKIGKWSVVKMPKYYKCWRQVAEQFKADISDEGCFLTYGTQIGGAERSGYIRANWSVVENKRKSVAQFYHLMDMMARGNNSQSSGGDRGDNEDFTANPLAGGDCKSERVRNKHGLLIQMRYCVGGYRDLPDLYSGSVSAAVVNERPNGLTMSVDAAGFTLDNLKKIITAQIDTVSLEN
jgi:serine protease Do